MKNVVGFFKLLAEENRMRLVFQLLDNELFVCQLMAVLGLSQPLVSSHLALLKRQGLLEQRRRGKLVFYRLRRDLPAWQREVLRLLRLELSSSDSIRRDSEVLALFRDKFQTASGRCDMATLKEFLKYRRSRQAKTQEKQPWKT